jgi:hypothetical protein
MMLSTLLVIMMTVPGLALFYGGLVRSKNMLSVLMQVMVGFSLIVVLWVLYGYSFAFTEGNKFIGGTDRLFMKGIWDNVAGTFANAATFSKGVYIPEIVFAAFQATFAGITACLIIGAFAERMKFSAVLAFLVLWFTFSYLPIAHMVGRAGLRWRHGGAHQRRGRRPGGRLHGRQARRLRPRAVHAAQPDADHGRCLAAVGGLVRLQRRLRPGSQRLCRAGLHQHAGRHGCRRAGLVRG